MGDEKKGDYKCARCGVEFSDYLSNRAKGKNFFCSTDCRAAWVGVQNSITRGGDGVKRTKSEKDARDYRKHVEQRRASALNYYHTNREKILTRLQLRDRALKTEVIAAYGGKCNCCGETHLEFLTIDHTDGSGAEHRRQKGRGRGIYQDLKDRGFPQDGYRLLCLNCNISLGFYGYCPHKPGEFRYVDKRPKTNVGRPITSVDVPPTVRQYEQSSLVFDKPIDKIAQRTMRVLELKIVQLKSQMASEVS